MRARAFRVRTMMIVVALAAGLFEAEVLRQRSRSLQEQALLHGMIAAISMSEVQRVESVLRGEPQPGRCAWPFYIDPQPARHNIAPEERDELLNRTRKLRSIYDEEGRIASEYEAARWNPWASLPSGGKMQGSPR